MLRRTGERRTTIKGKFLCGLFKPETRKWVLIACCLNWLRDITIWERNLMHACAESEKQQMLLVIHSVHLWEANPALNQQIYIFRHRPTQFSRYLTSFAYLGWHDAFYLLISSSLCNCNVRIATAYHSALQEFAPNGHCRGTSKCVIPRLCQNGTAAWTCQEGDVWT